VQFTPLDGAGAPLAAGAAATRRGGDWELALASPTTTYVVTVRR